MNRLSLFSIPAVLLSCSLQAQTVDKEIKKLSKDPKTSENAARADVYIAKKDLQIYDTTTIASNNGKKEKQSAKKRKSK